MPARCTITVARGIPSTARQPEVKHDFADGDMLRACVVDRRPQSAARQLSKAVPRLLLVLELGAPCLQHAGRSIEEEGLPHEAVRAVHLHDIS